MSGRLCMLIDGLGGWGLMVSLVRRTSELELGLQNLRTGTKQTSRRRLEDDAVYQC